jgi:ElaB/YqjD/DUF883 family membrane-anchored ribosome-binding protein
MISKDLSQSVSQTANHMADQAAQNTDRSIDATRSMVGQKMDGMADSMKHIHDQAAPLLDRASEVAKRGVNAARESSHQIIDKAGRASDHTVTYIKDEPVKAMLIAAATGAALMALVSVMSRSGRHG